MSQGYERILKSLLNVIKSADKKRTSAYDPTATVIRVEGNTAWVHISGGVAETPVKKTINCKAGDTVQVRVGGGKAWITGNLTAPPTDDTEAVKAGRTAAKARTIAKNAELAANDANEKADDAQALAEGTNEHFWHDNTGAHITEVEQEAYKANPSTAGGNLLMTSQGMAIRDGTTEIASFTGTKARIGRQNAFHVDVDSDSMDFTDSLGNSFSIESQGSQVYGGRMIKTVGEDVSSQVGVSADNIHAYSEIRAAYTPTDNSDYKTAHITLQAISGNSVEIAFDVSDMSGSAANWKFGQLRFNATAMTTSVPIVAPNIDCGVSTSVLVPSESESSLVIPFNKTFATVPVVTATINSTGVGQHQCFISVKTITTTSFEAYIRNIGSANRTIMINWIAMS